MPQGSSRMSSGTCSGVAGRLNGVTCRRASFASVGGSAGPWLPRPGLRPLESDLIEALTELGVGLDRLVPA